MSGRGGSVRNTARHLICDLQPPPRAPSMLSIQDLLNPAPAHVFCPGVSPAREPHTQSLSSSSPSRGSSVPSPSGLLFDLEHNIKINRTTSVSKLFRYPLDTIIEYPETSVNGAIGHLFDISPDNWLNPRLNFAYSQGKPSGRTKRGHEVYCDVLVNEDGVQVPC